MTNLEPLELDVGTAERIVGQLRVGIPPAGFVRQFTVGRQEELRALERDLRAGMHGKAVLVRANYGGGKTHLLNLVRDLALLNNYAVSFVEVSSHRGVRFNRMDQIFSAVCRSIQLPDRADRGIGALFRAYADVDVEKLDEDARDERHDVDDGGTWRQPGSVITGPVYIALRAAVVSESGDTWDTVVDWFTRGEPDKLPRTQLLEDLVDSLYVGDPRSRYQLYNEIKFRRDGQEPSWESLNDLNTLAELSGYRGLVLLFDEFEDVIQNLNNRLLEKNALENLFRFFAGGYEGAAYFAVTPDFVRKCRDRLMMKGVWDFPYERFDELPHWQLSPIELDDFLELSAQIMTAHAIAYEWHPETELDWAAVGQFIRESWQPNAPERIRIACRSLVEHLDAALERTS